MSFGNGFGERPRPGKSWYGALLMGLLGVAIGAVLVYVLFSVYIAPDLPWLPGLPSEDGVEPGEQAPPHHQDLAKVEVVNRVLPAVVGINRYVYRNHFGQQSLVEEGSGSGVVLSSEGYIVTNQHVVDQADEIRVVFPDAGTYPAELVGEDPLTDLALLKIEQSDLPFVPLGDSAGAWVGESVLAIGNPLGLFQQTVTAGIISAVGRQVRIPDSPYAYTFIQTDAVINPGNSGGPLINLRGEIIGINSAKVTRLGVEGIGLSIPSNTVRRVVDDLREHGRVRRPQLGVLVEDLSRVTGVSTDGGVLIREVLPDSPAWQSGLQAGDIIVMIGSQEVQYLAQLFDALLNFYPGDEITLNFMRDEKRQSVTVTLGEM
jgi:serine protease Do